MKTVSRVLCILVLFILSFSLHVVADVPTQIEYGADMHYPPFSYVHNFQLYGFDVDLVNLIFSTQDYSIRYSPDIWENVLDKLKTGDIQVISSIARTPEREEFVLFTDSIAKTYIGIYAKDNLSQLDIDDLYDLRIGVGNRYYEENILREELGIAEYFTYHSLNEAVEALIDGKIDVVFSNQEVMNYFIIQNNLKSVVLPVINDLYPREFYFGVGKNSPELVDFINMRLRELKRSGVYEELYQKYFYRRSDYYQTRQRNMMLAGVAGIIILILVIAVLTRFNIKYLKRRIKHEQEFSKKILDNANIMIVILDDAGVVAFVNSYVLQTTGYEEGDFVGHKWNTLPCIIRAEDKEGSTVVERSINTKVENRVIKLICRDGRRIYVNWNICDIEDEKDKKTYSICMGIDMTDRVETQKELRNKIEELTSAYEEISAMEEELRNNLSIVEKSQIALKESEERYRLAVEGSRDGIWDLDIKNDILYLADQTYDVLGIEKRSKALSMKEFIRLCHIDDRGKIINRFRRHITGETEIFEVEHRMRAGRGEYKWFLSRGKAVFSDGQAVRMLGSNTDITDIKLSQKRIEYYAYYDPLTELPNRMNFEKTIHNFLSDSRNSKTQFAILFMDIDNFKNVNDSFGHFIGDMLLKHVGEKLRGLLTENLVISRFSGDEFAFMLKKVDSINEITRVADEIISAIRKPFFLYDKEIYITASIGIARYPVDGDRMDLLFRYADVSVYQAKEKGKNRYQFFSRDIHDQILKNIEIKNDLREAVEKKQFEVYYQPIIDIYNDKVIGLEALIRWIHPEKGMISPMEFIPIAEETGMILDIGEWVLETACKQMVSWQTEGIRDILLHVNISPTQMQQDYFSKKVKDILNNTGFNPKFLQIEITENIAVTDLEGTITILEELNQIGIGISLDDFGTGFSSLNYLNKLPVDVVKIDKSFIDNIGHVKDQEAIVKIIIVLSHVLGMKVIAEGVEDEKQVNLLKRYGCDYVQGYFYSKPLPREEIFELL